MYPNDSNEAVDITFKGVNGIVGPLVDPGRWVKTKQHFH